MNHRHIFGLSFALAFSLAGASAIQPIVITTLHAFNGPDGIYPGFPVSIGPGGVLFGTTSAGGANGSGAIFKLNPADGSFMVIHSFTTGEQNLGAGEPPFVPGAAVIVGADHELYGFTLEGTNYPNGLVFKMDRDGNNFTVLSTNGGFNLMQGSDGVLYGTGLAIFKLDTDGGNYLVLHTLTNSTDGSKPYGKMIMDGDGILYGTCYQGGSNSEGTVFKINSDGSGFSVVHSFPAFAGDGANPYAGVIEGSDGALYGTTKGGGTDGWGTVFKLGRDGSGYQVLYNFTNDGVAGFYPYGALVEGSDRVLYGTCETGGGADSAGTIFEIGLDGSGYGYVNLSNAATNIPSTPYDGLVAGVASDGSGVLYGTSEKTVGNDQGTVFAVVINPPATIAASASQTAGGQIVTWPAWATGYELQTTTNLTDNSWTTVSNGVLVTGLQLTNSQPNAFYRLIWKQ